VLLRAAAPDAATFRILTSARQPAAAVDVLRCMPGLLDPDPCHCRTVLASLGQCAPARDAAAFLDDMRRWGVWPNRSDHRVVVDAFLREEKTAEAYDHVVKQMDADGAAPGLPEFERMLRAFRARRDFDAVEVVFDEMLLRGLVPGARVYDAYLGALCDRGDLAGARRMVDCMDRAGCPPDVTTFGVVVAGCVAAGDVGAAREAAREAVRRGLRWDAPAMSELVDARARGVLLESMRAAGMDASSAFSQQLLTGGGAPLCEDQEGPTTTR
jgi:pentatricopeptide repeat protein